MKRKRTARDFLEDIVTAMDKVQRYVAGGTEESFEQDEILVDAVLRNLEIIGEAAGGVPEDLQAQYPDVPWRKMKGLRNLLAHEYFGIDLSIIWEIASSNIPDTLKPVKEALEDCRDD